MRSGCMIVYAILTSTSRLPFCINSLCLWMNTSQYWNIFLSRYADREDPNLYFLRPFWPQIYAISLLSASVFQKDYGCSPPLSPSSHSCSANIRASGYFRPRLLVARLQSLPQLEELSIGFSIPIPRPSAERELLGEQGTPVTLPNLKTPHSSKALALIWNALSLKLGPLFWSDSTSRYSIKSPLHYHTCPTSPISQKGSSSLSRRFTFDRDKVSVIMDHHNSPRYDETYFSSV